MKQWESKPGIWALEGLQRGASVWSSWSWLAQGEAEIASEFLFLFSELSIGCLVPSLCLWRMGLAGWLSPHWDESQVARLSSMLFWVGVKPLVSVGPQGKGSVRLPARYSSTPANALPTVGFSYLIAMLVFNIQHAAITCSLRIDLALILINCLLFKRPQSRLSFTFSFCSNPIGFLCFSLDVRKITKKSQVKLFYF